MSVVFITSPSFLDLSLCLVRSLAESVRVHLVVEVAPESWNTNVMGSRPRGISPGLVDAAPFFRETLPAAVADYWQACESVHLAVFETRYFDPRTRVAARRMIGALKKLEPEIIHAQDPTLRLLWGLGAANLVPLVVDVHDPVPHSDVPSQRRIERLVRKRLAAAARIILHNKSQFDGFTSLWQVPAENVAAVPLGIYTIFRDWSPVETAQESSMALFFGRLSRYKGLDTLVAATSSVAQRVPRLKVVIAGPPVPGFKLPELPPLPNGGGFEVIDGHVVVADVAALMQRAGVVVLPYDDATQSGVLLTAFAFEKPVVATNVGGMSEYIEDGVTGVLVEPRDPDALAGAISRVMGDGQLRQHLSSGVAAAARGRLGWSTIAQGTVAVYEEAIKAGAPHDS